VQCNTWYIDYKRKIDKLASCNTYQLSVPPSNNQVTWNVENPSWYTNQFPGIGGTASLELQPGQGGGSDVITYTILHHNTSWMQPPNTVLGDYTETVSGPISVSPLETPVIHGQTNIPVATNKFYYATFNYSYPLWMNWEVSGPLQIVSGQNSSSCTIRANNCGQGVLTFNLWNACETQTVRKTIYIDCPKLLVFPNPASTELNVELNGDLMGDPTFEYSLINEHALTKRINRTKEKQISFDVSDLPNGLYVIKVLLLRPDQDAIELSEQLIIRR
jgi:hypothetical protein